MKAKQNRSEQTRTKIKAAALRLFNTKGFRGTTLAEIGRKTKISKVLVAYHFAKTELILFELMQEWAQSGQQVTDEYLKDLAGEKPQQLILAIQDAAVKWMDERPEMATFTLVLIQAATEASEVRRFLFNVFEAGRRRIEEMLQKIAQPQSESDAAEVYARAFSIHCLIFGSCLYILAQGNKDHLKLTAEFNRQVIATVIGSSSSPKK